MNNRAAESAPSPHAYKLRALIDQLAHAALAAQSNPRNSTTELPTDCAEGALLYLGNIHDAVPRGLLYDPLLTTVDIVTWQAIRIHAGMQGAARFPRYEDLLAIVRVSKPTLGRAITVLRIVRWLSMITLTQRNERGQIHFQGRVYALHDERIPLADALHLDPLYIEIVQQHCQHRYEPLARIARCIRTEFHDGIEVLRQGDVGSDAEVIDRPVVVAAWVKNLNASDPARSAAGVKKFNPGAFAHCDKEFLQESDKNPGVKNFNSGNDKKNSSSKNKNINITTTNTTTDLFDKSARVTLKNKNSLSSEELFSQGEDTSCAQWAAPLLAFLNHDAVWIERLTQQLADLPLATAQAVLDEAAGSLGAKLRRNEPIDNPTGYVHALIRRARYGQFTPTAYGQAGRAMRYEGKPISHVQVLDGASGEALLFAQGSQCQTPSALHILIDTSWADGLVQRHAEYSDDASGSQGTTPSLHPLHPLHREFCAQSGSLGTTANRRSRLIDSGDEDQYLQHNAEENGSGDIL